MPIVTDTGFAPDAWRAAGADDGPAPGALAPFDAFLERAVEAVPEGSGALIAPTCGVEEIAPYFPRLALIAVPFEAFSDGRGFSLARRLRAAGYGGRLRATGAVIPDQYAYARAAGFDEVAISEERAARQPEADWLRDARRPGWYQRNLLNGAGAA